jgi:hypothetical protein
MRDPINASYERIYTTSLEYGCLSLSYKCSRVLLTTFSLGVLFSLVLAGALAATTERGSSEGYPVLPVATASSGGDSEGGGEQGGDQSGDEDGGGDSDGSTDFQPDSDTDEETETTDETATDEETQPEPTPDLDLTPEPSPTPSPQELVEICANGQDDDNDGQIDEADSDCVTERALTPIPNALPTPATSPTQDSHILVMPNADGTCPEGSHKFPGSQVCEKDTILPTTGGSATPTPQTLNQQTCPPLPIDVNGRCPGIDMRGGGLGLPPVPETAQVVKEIPLLPDGSCNGVFDPDTNKCYEGSYAPTCPGKPGENPYEAGRGRDVYGICRDPQTGNPLPVTFEEAPGECLNGGVHIAAKQRLCFMEEAYYRAPDGSCLSGYFPSGENNDRCSLKIHDPLPDGSCPAGYHNIPAPAAPVPGGTLCKLDVLKLTNDDLTSELPGGYCPVGYQKRSGFAENQCFRIS